VTVGRITLRLGGDGVGKRNAPRPADPGLITWAGLSGFGEAYGAARCQSSDHCDLIRKDRNRRRPNLVASPVRYSPGLRGWFPIRFRLRWPEFYFLVFPAIRERDVLRSIREVHKAYPRRSRYRLVWFSGAFC